MTKQTQCLVVEAHFVGDYTTAPVKLKGLTVSELRQVIERLLRQFEPVTSAQLTDYFSNGGIIPERSFYLTFDDGIRDHVSNVLPALQAHRLEASFFIPGCLFDEERRLPVLEKQRFLQYAYGDYDQFLRRFCECVTAHARDGVVEIEPSAENLARMGTYLAEYGFYSPAERYYRYLRDRVLDHVAFAGAVERLFEERFGSDEEICRSYYMSTEDVQTLHRSGMVIGGHTYSHEHLPRLGDQRQDIVRGLSILERLTGVRPATFSYPYGSYDETTLSVMASLDMVYAFTTTNRPSSLERTRPYEITRVDAKELVQS